MVNLPGMKKAPKIGRALKSAAMLPTRAVAGRGSGRQDMLSPLQGELPVVLLRVQVVGCKNQVAKDKGGTSDP
jgi:phosphatidylserine decarboxylase